MVMIIAFRKATELSPIKKRMLDIIAKKGEMAQAEIVDLFKNEASQPTIWRGLRDLETVGLIDISIGDGRTRICKISADGKAEISKGVIKEMSNAKVMAISKP